MNKVHILGAGPGQKDYTLPITKKIIDRADVLIAGQRLLADFGRDAQQKIKITADLASIREFIKENYQQKKIAVLVSGDPGLYSFLTYLKRYFPRESLEVIPGISSLQLAFARNKMTWQEARIISLHGKNNRERLKNFVRKYNKVGLFTDRKNSPDQIAGFLLDNQINEKQVVVCENLSYPEEKIYRGSLQDIKEQEFAPLTVMLIYDHQKKALKKQWPYTTGGIPDQMFIRGDIPMTKEEIRTITIAKLRLKRDSIVYDIGAGTGSLTIEAALQADQGQVYAIEKEKEGIELISENCQKFGTANVQTVHGSAPRILKELPTPERVIIGGSGGQLRGILNMVDQKLSSGARIVLNTITINTLSQAFRLLQELNYEFQMTNLTVSRDNDLAGYKMMQALNPVYVISAQKKQD
ncbi:MAG: precorrin-6y C5,15-methyltransferase (decarboxylating) subunit CbiE [Bacillota bacterium]